MTGLEILAIIAGLIGILGSILPGLPGPPISWVGILLMYFNGMKGDGDIVSLTALFVWLAVTIIVSILDYIVPAYFTKVTGGSKYASIGAVVGLFAGMFFTAIGMIMGSLLGAFIAELLFARKDAIASFKATLGAFLGFIFGTGLKIICSGLMMYYIIKVL